MYLLFKHGFVSVVAVDWSNTRLVGKHREAANAASTSPIENCGVPGHMAVQVLCVRSRDQSTVRWVSNATSRRPVVFKSPPGWDYEWRAYLNVQEWALVMSRIASELDYTNVKTYLGETDSQLEEVAYGVWHAVRDAFPQEKRVTQHDAEAEAWAHFDATPVKSTAAAKNAAGQRRARKKRKSKN